MTQSRRPEGRQLPILINVYEVIDPTDENVRQYRLEIGAGGEMRNQIENNELLITAFITAAFSLDQSPHHLFYYITVAQMEQSQINNLDPNLDPEKN